MEKKVVDKCECGGDLVLIQLLKIPDETCIVYQCEDCEQVTELIVKSANDCSKAGH